MRNLSLSVLDGLLGSSVFWGVVALILGALAVSGKFSMRMANALLFCAWLVGTIGIYRSNAVRDLRLILCLSLVLGAILSLLSYFLRPLQTAATQSTTPAASLATTSAPSDISGEILDVRVEATEVTFIADPYRANLSAFVLARLVSSLSHPITIVNFKVVFEFDGKNLSAEASSQDFSKWRMFWQSDEQNDFGFKVKKSHYDPLPSLMPEVSATPLHQGVHKQGWLRFDFEDTEEAKLEQADKISLVVTDALKKQHVIEHSKPLPKGNGTLAEPSWLNS